MVSKKFRFVKKVLAELPVTDKRTRYYDTDVAGLILEITPKGKRVFRVYKRMKTSDAPLSVTLGQFPDLTIEQARELAREKLNIIVKLLTSQLSGLRVIR